MTHVPHLPECTDDLRWMLNPGEWVDEETGEAECVLCCMLRACEKRVREEERTRYDDDGAERDIREAALREARDAVAGVQIGGDHFWSVGFRDGITVACSAIDALRGVRYSDSHQPQVDGTEKRYE